MSNSSTHSFGSKSQLISCLIPIISFSTLFFSVSEIFYFDENKVEIKTHFDYLASISSGLLPPREMVSIMHVLSNSQPCTPHFPTSPSFSLFQVFIVLFSISLVSCVFLTPQSSWAKQENLELGTHKMPDPSSPTHSPIAMHGTAGRAVLNHLTLIAPDFPDTETLSVDLRPYMHKQLQYLVGNLHGFEGGVELHNFEIITLQKQDLSSLALDSLEEGLASYQYSVAVDALILSSLAPEAGQSKIFPVFLPQKVDEVSLKALFDTYGPDCNPNPHKSYKAQTYWYDFRPQAYYCVLNQSTDLNPPYLIQTDMHFTAFTSQKQEISPDYQAIWSDGKLVVTAVYALVGGLLGEQGQEGYQQVFKDLVRTYGKPSYINHDFLVDARRIDIDTPVIDALFDTPRGPLEVHLFLINSLENPSHVDGDELETFVEDYNVWTQQSDLVIYNGHAHHGRDNANLDALGVFSPNHYQIFYVNTCASYTYGLPRIQEQYRLLNQETVHPRGFLDLVVNGMPAMGHEIASMNGRYIHALVEAQESYPRLLEGMYSKQQMLVLYNQDAPSLVSKSDQSSVLNDSNSSRFTSVDVDQNQLKSIRQSGCQLGSSSSSHHLWIGLMMLMFFLRKSRQTLRNLNAE